MLFHTWQFAGFFCVVYALYLLLQGRHRAQNIMLLAASYYFYGAWDYRFLALMWVSTAIDYACSRRISQATGRRRRAWLLASIITNLGVLGFFKYHDFFIDSFADLLTALSLPSSRYTLGVILPVGLSFYTFQAMSYNIDAYRGEFEPTDDPIDFALYLAFFPQLVAGPIERAARLLPQVTNPRTIRWSDVDVGAFWVLWGLFKKAFIADNVARLAGPIFAAPQDFSPRDLICAALAFSVQIYCDFSGYSDIARGLARLFGFHLMANFKLPYFARNPSEFWQRWHVSLSEWLRNYLYIPLGGNRGGRWLTARNLLLTMLLGGLWHGAAWHFVWWGLYHGVLLVTHRALAPGLARLRGWPFALLGWATMTCLSVAGWVLFRVESMSDALTFFGRIGFEPGASSSQYFRDLAFYCAPLVIVECFLFLRDDLLALVKLPVGAREVLYAAMICALLVFGVREPMEFIYFQF